jgi:hypothetical protein
MTSKILENRRFRLVFAGVVLILLVRTAVAWAVGDPYPPNCSATGPGVTGGYVNTPVEVFITSRDAANIIIVDPVNYTVNVTWNGHKVRHTEPVLNQDGTMSVWYTPHHPSPGWAVEILLNGTDNISGSPYQPDFVR